MAPASLKVIFFWFLLAVTPIVYGQEHPDAKFLDRGFRMFVAFDRVYLPRNADDRVGGSAAQDRVISGFVAVFMDGKQPKYDTFEVGKTPIPIIWKSSNPSVIKFGFGNELLGDGSGGTPVVRVLSPGRSEISVSVGKWSARRTIRVIQIPFSLKTRAKDILAKKGYPQNEADHLPRGSLAFGEDNTPSAWEYDEWPGCRLLIGAEELRGIATTPAIPSANSGLLSGW